jgi:phosphatidylserine decarboxylase
MRNSTTPIAVEGLPFLVPCLGITLLLVVLGDKLPLLYPVAGFIGLVTLFIAFFFRNPQRTCSEPATAVVAPADGVVIYLGPAVEEHLGAEMTKISIFMSVFNVHINRVPVSARVLDSFYTAGKFLDVRDERATFENERSGLVLETEQGWKLVVVQVAGLIARRIVCYAQKGDLLERGKRYGLIRFGSRLDVYLPKECTVKVSMGQKSVAGETVLGYLP